MDIKNLKDCSSYLGNPLQLFGVEKFVGGEGTAKGAEFFRVRTGGGLEYFVSSDNALDLSSLSYKGIPINYLSKNGQVSPSFYHPVNSEFLHTFNGGMLYTCGLTNTGDEVIENGLVYPVHGRVHYIPATEISAKTDENGIEISGKIRETELWGSSFEIKRKISSPTGENKIILTDKITNRTENETEFELIYHMNFGFPFFSPDLKIKGTENAKVFARTENAKANIENRYKFSTPIENKEEELFFHENISQIVLENPSLKTGVKISWSQKTLPVMIEWKSEKCGEYVLGIEPSNNYVLGRTEERNNGSLQKIKPYETVETSVSLEFFDI